MTHRHSGYLVTLQSDLREDDAEKTISALEMITGVISVAPVLADLQTAVGKSRSDHEWQDKIMDLLKKKDVPNV